MAKRGSGAKFSTKLFYFGLIVTVLGAGGRFIAVRMINDSPMLIMGAAVSGMFDSVAHLTTQEKLIFACAQYGTQVSLVGVGSMILALVLRRLW